MNQNDSININNNNNTNISEADISEIYNESILQMLDEPFELRIDTSKLRTDEAFYGFDNHTGDTWIYPSNYPIRQYQYNIAKVSLFKNTLVALPTGLGKTFIAAVVMYNFYRWYPHGKIIFMAPTRPLVAQQIEACYKIMGIPKNDTVEITGKQSKSVRELYWQRKRVFFATPQTVMSDLCSLENFPFNNIKLLVVDEAHKAKGKYAYTEVVQSINNRNHWFRVLALSATPGRHIEDVVEVVRNLLISHVEIRWENSIDVSPYVYKKNIKTEVVRLDRRIIEIREQLINIIDKYVRILSENDAIQGSTGSLNKMSLLMQQKRYQEQSRHHNQKNHSEIAYNFSSAISLYHSLELLELNGIRSFLNFFDDNTNSTKEKFFVAKDQELRNLLNSVRNRIGLNPLTINNETLPDGSYLEIPNDLDFGHPKFRILEQYLIEYFKTKGDSRVIVFSEYRETVQLIHRLLLRNRPAIKPGIIVGKGCVKSSLTEKEQKQVMNKFREGIFNTLIATCVAEEGIDVGEVDLIICFDISTRNPTRFIQRIGRTGRKREGRVVMLVTEGHEQGVLKDVLSNKDKTNQKIVRSNEILKNLYKKSPRLVPTEFDPKCVETFITTEDQITMDKSKESKNKSKKIKSPKRKVEKPSTSAGHRNIYEFFKKIDFDPYEAEVFTPPPDYQKPKKSDEKQVQCANSTMNNNDQLINIRSPTKTKSLIKKLIREQKTMLTSSKKDQENKKQTSKIQIEQVIRNENEKYDPFKRLALRLNPEFLLEKIEAQTILEAVSENNNENDDVIMIDPEVENLRKDLKTFDKIFNGQENLNKFLVNYKEMKRYLNHARTINLYNCDLTRLDINFNDFTGISKEKIEELKISYEKLKKINDVEILEVFDESIEVKSVYSEEDHIIYNDESKYRMETPKKCNPIQESMLMNEQCNETSPLMLSFNKSIKKKYNSDNLHELLRDQNKNQPSGSVLSYFLLKDFDEIFSEESEPTFSKNLFPSCESERNFDIGTIDDIFVSSDDDLFADEDEIENVPGKVIEKSKKYDTSSDIFGGSSVFLDIKGVEENKSSSESKENVHPSLNQVKISNFPRPNYSNLKKSEQSIIATQINPVISREESASPCPSPEDLAPTQINQSLFLTQLNPVLNRKRQIIESSSDDSQATQIFEYDPNPKPSNSKKPKLSRCNFIDYEADVVDDSFEDDEEIGSETQLFHMNSIIDDNPVHDSEVNDNMRRVYLNSIKEANQGKFKIPLKTNQDIPYDQIFSQIPEVDETYRELDDSFIVDEDENIIESDKELCPLEKAEMILKEKLRKKRLKKRMIGNSNKRRKKIIPINDKSSDEDEEIKLFREKLQEEDNSFL